MRRFTSTSVVAEYTSKGRTAAGLPYANTYVNLMQNFFVPEVTKRVAARTPHTVEFIEGYGGDGIMNAIRGIPGLDRVDISTEEGSPQLGIALDREALALLAAAPYDEDSSAFV